MKPLNVQRCAFEGCHKLTTQRLCEKHRRKASESPVSAAARAREAREEREQADPLYPVTASEAS
jgi:hypothetical protein